MTSDSKKNKNSAFNKALGNFTFDMAGRGAIRHLFDLGFSVEEIKAELLYPVPAEKISEEIWEYLLESNTVLIKEPGDDFKDIRYEYVKETNEYGRVSFRRVEVAREEEDYIKVEFGKLKYKYGKELKEKLKGMAPCYISYITDIPWPLSPVWHKKSEKLEKLLKALEEAGV